MINLYDTWFIEHYGQKFYTIKDALDSLQDKFKDSYLNFYDESFSKYDWSIEPHESFEDLKKIRAQQIREKYSYVRIFASYASDSGTVINSFLKNKLEINEIVNYVSKWENNLTALEQEHHTLFVPNIKKYLMDTRSTKITLKEITFKDVYELLRTENKNMSGVVPSRFDISNLSTNLSGKGSFIDVYGECKPLIGIAKGIFFFKFNLAYVHDMIARPETINFFTTPEFPKLHIKQCHMLKNNIKKYWPSLVQDSFDRVIYIGESGKFPDGSSMESFIELSCRDFTDLNLAVPKLSSNHVVRFGFTDKEKERVMGFYKNNQSLLTDYLDYVKSYYTSNLFIKNNNKLEKVFLNSKYYSLGS